MVTWPKFGNSSISVREVIITLTLTAFFKGWSWFKFNNLRLTLGMNLKFYTSVPKGLKLKVRTFWRLIPTFVEVTGEKLVGGLFGPSPILNRVKKRLHHRNFPVNFIEFLRTPILKNICERLLLNSKCYVLLKGSICYYRWIYKIWILFFEWAKIFFFHRVHRSACDF